MIQFTQELFKATPDPFVNTCSGVSVGDLEAVGPGLLPCVNGVSVDDAGGGVVALGEDVQAEIAALFDPLVVLLG
ncbi:hypothetical protein [Gleimia hominis]|uniref:hypothetical protein n=1 Tax=Gleimia hominis TaxID=595468 RepID=UPI000C810495|nr:hypothetical protein [Gleimia hominis]WIK65058.1 hypothetical protein CJ187_003120 [Gleimia hominis]